MCLHQIVLRSSENKKQLCVRVMPVLIHAKAYSVIHSLVPGGSGLPEPSSKKPIKRGYAETWNAALKIDFREYVTNDFVTNYRNRVSSEE